MAIVLCGRLSCIFYDVAKFFMLFFRAIKFFLSTLEFKFKFMGVRMEAKRKE